MIIEEASPEEEKKEDELYKEMEETSYAAILIVW